MNIIGSNEGEIIILLFLYACGVIAGGFAGALIYRWHWRRRMDRLGIAAAASLVTVGIAACDIEKGDVVTIIKSDDGSNDWQSWPEALREGRL